MEDGLANILRVYSMATPVEIRNGLAWYSTAYEEAVRIAVLYKLELITVVQVACALSPRLQWEVNMSIAEKVIRYYVSGGRVPDIQPYADKVAVLQRTTKHDGIKPVISDADYLPATAATRVNTIKALWILQGHTWVLRGKKVSSFLDNILNHSTSRKVTVDSHAIQVWLGKMEAGTYAVPEAFYSILEADYIKAADMLGMTPLQCQAITWLTKKRVTKEQGKR
jgi:hypothetical protein